MATYPMTVAVSCPSVARLYVSTDSPKLKEIALAVGAEIIERPPHLASKQALGEHAYVHGYQVIRERLAAEGEKLELLVLLFANAATVTPQIIEEGISVLRANPEIDSAVSVSCYNMWSPLRARKINAQGLLDPFVPFETFGDPKTMNCDRDSQGDVWFADMGVSIVRPHCLDNLEEGLLPQKWMGRKIHPLKQWGGLDVDEPWQMPWVENWLQAHEVDKLFRIQQTRWAQFYDSERTVLAMLQLGPKSRVLDVGNEPGGLGLALRERFGVTDYTVALPAGAPTHELKLVNPDARVAELESLGTEGAFDLVAGLRTDDDAEFLRKRLWKAYAQLAPGGTLVFTVRLTDKATVNDAIVSSQTVYTGKGRKKQQAYIIWNTQEVMDALKSLWPARIFAYGYSGTPSSSARTPLKNVCFAVFAVTRAGYGAGEDEAHVELQLPKQFQ